MDENFKILMRVSLSGGGRDGRSGEGSQLDLVDGEVVLGQARDDGVVKRSGHNRFTIQDPDVFIGGIADDGIAVVAGKTDNPVRSSDVESLREADGELGVGAVIGDGFTNGRGLFSQSGASVVDLDGAIGVKGISGDVVGASEFEDEWDLGLLIPNSHISGEVDRGNSLRWGDVTLGLEGVFKGECSAADDQETHEKDSFHHGFYF